MPDMRPRVSEDTYFDLRLASAEFQRELKRQITISELITAAWKITKNHPDELRQILASNK
jgi:hypothetical protein